ncbi:MAG: bifunctional DNA primase/polymerase [Actinoplanes sp.]
MLLNPLITPGSAARFTQGPYGSTACLYYAAGWQPLPMASKVPAVSGHHGREAGPVGWTEMVKAWVPKMGGLGVAVRLISEIGIDVDAHDGQAGAETFMKVVEALGPLPPTYSSTSRGPYQSSRIHFYRIPWDLDVSQAETKIRKAFGPNIDIIHRGNRYAVVAPTVHPRTGEIYRWYGPDGQEAPMPRRSDLAMLPETWQEFMRSSPRPAPRLPKPSGPLVASPGEDDWYDDVSTAYALTNRQAGEKLIDLQRALESVVVGEVERTLNSVAFELGRLSQAGFFTPEEAFDTAAWWLRKAPARHSDAWNRENGRKWTYRSKFTKGFQDGWNAGGLERISA